MSKFEENLKDRFKDEQSLNGINESQLWAGIEEAIADDDSGGAGYWLNGKLLMGITIGVVVSIFGYYTFFNEDIESQSSGKNVHTDIEYRDHSTALSKKMTINSSVESDDSNIQDADDNQPFQNEKQLSEQIEGVDLKQERDLIEGEDLTSDNLKDETIKSANAVQNSSNLNSNKSSIGSRLENINTDLKTSINQSTSKINVVNVQTGNDQLILVDDIVSGRTSVEKIDGDSNSSTLEAVGNTPVIESGGQFDFSKTGIEDDSDSEMESIINVIEFMPLQELSLTSQSDGELHTTKDEFLDFMIPPPTKWALSAYGGLNTTSKTFINAGENSAYLEELNNAFSNSYAQYGGVEVQYSIKDPFYIASGLEFGVSSTQFYYFNEKDSIAIINNEQVAGIGTREVRHYNKFSYLAVPLLVGYERSTGRFLYGINGGIAINLVTNQEGKTLSPSESIVTYSVDSDDIPNKDFFLSYQVNPYLGYRFGEKWQVNIKPTFRLQPYNKSSLYNMSHRDVIGGVSVGCGVRF